MSTIADEINNQIDAGRRTVKRSLDGMPGSLDVRRVRPAAYVAVGVILAAAALGAGWAMYRSRRRRTLVDRLQDALPDSVKDLPQGLREQVRRPLEKAVKAL